MEINPFKTNITFNEYLDKINISNNAKIIHYPTVDYYSLIQPLEVIYYYEQKYSYKLIIGFYKHNINNIIYCTLIDTSINNSNKIIFDTGGNIKIEVEVILKSELKDLKYIEQTELFKEDEQRKD